MSSFIGRCLEDKSKKKMGGFPNEIKKMTNGGGQRELPEIFAEIKRLYFIFIL